MRAAPARADGNAARVALSGTIRPRLALSIESAEANAHLVQRRGNMKSLLTAAIIVAGVAIAPAIAGAQERIGDGAMGAAAGAIVGGPVGAVAGGVVGYTAGPTISRGLGFHHRYHHHYRHYSRHANHQHDASR
ncbi:MAG: hypothetical protein WBD48_09970 [Pseudolabrys sp.]